MDLLQEVETKMGSLGWYAAIIAFVCTLLGVCCPTMLEEDEWTGRQVAKTNKQTWQQAYNFAEQNYCKTWGICCAKIDRYTALTAWRKEKLRKEAADIPLSEVENDLFHARTTQVLSDVQPWVRRDEVLVLIWNRKTSRFIYLCETNNKTPESVLPYGQRKQLLWVKRIHWRSSQQKWVFQGSKDLLGSVSPLGTFSLCRDLGKTFYRIYAFGIQQSNSCMSVLKDISVANSEKNS